MERVIAYCGMVCSDCAGCSNYSCGTLEKHFENSPESKAVLDELRAER